MTNGRENEREPAGTDGLRVGTLGLRVVEIRSREHVTMDRDARFARIYRELARGEYLLAYDAAREAAEAHPGNPEPRYCGVLALARAGASERAEEEFVAAGLQSLDELDVPRSLHEDVLALGARLAKDRAVRASGDLRKELAREAARRYEDVYLRFDDPYPCVNAATMWLLGGDAARAATLARAALARVDQTAPVEPDDRYWGAATQAEAALLLDDVASAVDALDRAAHVAPTDFAARASTRRQLGLVCASKNIDVAVLERLPVPRVIHYCGHRLSAEGRGRLATEAVPTIQHAVTSYLDERDVGFAYGSLASGADLIVARAVLARGGELHAFLPFPRDEFVATSVGDAGKHWVETFEECADGATSLTVLGDGPYGGDDVLFAYCARVAMGSALIRAAFLTADVEQLAVWDEETRATPNCTAGDVTAWRARGMTTRVIATGSRDPAATTDPSPPRRTIRAMLFADVAHFSVLDDLQMASFGTTVLDQVAETLSRYKSEVLNQRTWGDGLHVVFDDVISAAHCALDLHETFEAIDWSAAGFTTPLALRVGLHAGPVVEIYDAVRAHVDFTGSHIVRTARIEPATPVGDVYVTDPYAALLTLAGDVSLSCQYVGHVPTAKGYGTFPLYVLKRRPVAPSS